MSFQRMRQPSSSVAVTAYAGTIESTPPTSEPKNGAPSTTIAAPSSAIATSAPRRPPMRYGEQPGEQQRAGGERGVGRGCRARRSGPTTVGVYPNTVLNCSRAPVATSTTISPTRMPSAHDERRDARIGVRRREPREQRDQRCRRRTGTASTARRRGCRRERARRGTSRRGSRSARARPARSRSSARRPSRTNAISAASGQDDLQHDEPHGDRRDLAVAELRGRVGVDHPVEPFGEVAAGAAERTSAGPPSPAGGSSPS